MRKERLIHGGGCVGLISTGKNHWRFFIPLFVIYWIVGFITNYLRAHQGTSTILYCSVEFFGIFIDAVWMGYFAFAFIIQTQVEELCRSCSSSSPIRTGLRLR